MTVEDCKSQYKLLNWHIDGSPKIINCILRGEHTMHKCDGYTWSTDDQYIGVLINDVLKKSVQVGGTHYEKMAIQPWEVIQRGDLDFFEGNVVKYVMRYRDKNGLEDLQKARHYLDYLIEREKKNAELDI